MLFTLGLKLCKNTIPYDQKLKVNKEICKLARVVGTVGLFFFFSLKEKKKMVFCHSFLEWLF